MNTKMLSKTDSRILACVFDPESVQATQNVAVDPNLPEDNQITDREVLQRIAGRQRHAIRLIEQFEKSEQQIDSAKDETYKAAITILDDLIAEYPDFAAAWNDRAQLRRWRYGDHNTICQNASSIAKERAEMGAAAVRDLRTALKLAAPARPEDSVSPKQGRLLAQSYTQLGAILLAASKDLENQDCTVVDAGFEGWTISRFEDEASQAFFLGGAYGNEVARALAVHTNPHAKLCGSVVEEAIRREISAGLS
jgi:hypothetical protein